MSNNGFNNLAEEMGGLSMKSFLPYMADLKKLEEEILAKCQDTDIDLMSGKISNKTIDVCVKLIMFDNFFKSMEGQNFRRRPNLNLYIHDIGARKTLRDKIKIESLPQVLSKRRTLILASNFIFKQGKMVRTLMSIFSRKQGPTYSLELKDEVLSEILRRISLVDDKSLDTTLITAINFFLSPPTRAEVQELMNEAELEVIRNESEKLREQREFDALLRRLKALKGPTFEERLAELKRGLSRGGPGGKTKRKGRNSKKGNGKKTKTSGSRTKTSGNKTKTSGNKTRGHGNKTRRKRSRRARKL